MFLLVFQTFYSGESFMFNLTKIAMAAATVVAVGLVATPVMARDGNRGGDSGSGGDRSGSDNSRGRSSDDSGSRSRGSEGGHSGGHDSEGGPGHDR
jgi:hypothetical protein